LRFLDDLLTLYSTLLICFPLSLTSFEPVFVFPISLLNRDQAYLLLFSELFTAILNDCSLIWVFNLLFLFLCFLYVFQVSGEFVLIAFFFSWLILKEFCVYSFVIQIRFDFLIFIFFIGACLFRIILIISQYRLYLLFISVFSFIIVHQGA